MMVNSNGRGALRGATPQPSSLASSRRNPDKTHAPSPLLTVSKVFGIIGVPASSLMAEISAAQRIVAMLMKSALFAMYRPGQILRYTFNWFKFGAKDDGNTLVRSPEIKLVTTG